MKALCVSKYFSPKSILQNKTTSFSLGGVALSGHRVWILVEDCRPGSKKSAMFQKSEASSATTLHYGLCLSLVLSGKPHQGTVTWRILGAGGSGIDRGATKGKLRHGLDIAILAI